MVHRPRRFASEAIGSQVHHASADGDRLTVLAAVGVAYKGGASVAVGDDKTF